MNPMSLLRRHNIFRRRDCWRTYRYLSLHLTRHTSYFKNHGLDFIYHTSWLPCHCLNDTNIFSRKNHFWTYRYVSSHFTRHTSYATHHCANFIYHTSYSIFQKSWFRLYISHVMTPMSLLRRQNIFRRRDCWRTYRYFSLHFTRHTSYFKNHGLDFICHTEWLPCHSLDNRRIDRLGTYRYFISHFTRHTSYATHHGLDLIYHTLWLTISWFRRQNILGRRNRYWTYRKISSHFTRRYYHVN